jgi:hypothetical protein
MASGTPSSPASKMPMSAGETTVCAGSPGNTVSPSATSGLTLASEAAALRTIGAISGAPSPKSTQQPARMPMPPSISRSTSTAAAARSPRGVPVNVMPNALTKHVTASAPVMPSRTIATGAATRSTMPPCSAASNKAW